MKFEDDRTIAAASPTAVAERAVVRSAAGGIGEPLADVAEAATAGRGDVPAHGMRVRARTFVHPVGVRFDRQSLR